VDCKKTFSEYLNFGFWFETGGFRRFGKLSDSFGRKEGREMRARFYAAEDEDYLNICVC